jgi:superfamily II DNA/RNA helicase
MSFLVLAGRRLWRRSSAAPVRLQTPSWCLHALTMRTDVNGDGDHTILMFSATFPKSARRLAKEYMEDDHVTIK